MFGWNDDNEQKFRDLWAIGRSASQIAGELGTTRSAVCAKARRMNLSRRVATGGRPERAIVPDDPTAPNVVSLPPRRPRLQGPPVDRRTRQEMVMPARAPRPAPVPMPRLKEPEPAKKPDGAHFTIMDVSEKVCRWPIGTPGEEAFHFCGNATRNPGLAPYCEYHEQLSVQPVQQRRAP